MDTSVNLLIAAVSVITTIGGMVGVVWRLRGDLDRKFYEQDERREAQFIKSDSKTETYYRCVLKEMTTMAKALVEIEGRIALGNAWHTAHENEDIRRFDAMQKQLDEIRSMLKLRTAWRPNGETQ